MNFKDLLDRYLKLPESQRFLIVGAILLFIFFLFFYFSYIPSRTKLKSAQKTLADKIRVKNEKQILASELEKFQKEVEKLDKDLNATKTMLPPTAEEPEIIKLLAQRASETGISILSLVPKGSSPKGFYNEIFFDLEVEGGYHDIASFFDSLSKVERIMSVGEFNLKPAPRMQDKKGFEAGAVKLVSRFQLITYMLSPQPAQAIPAGGKK